MVGTTVMGMAKLMHSLFFVSMAVAINKTVPSHQRAKMNALGLTGNSVVKAAGPLLAGSIVTWCFAGSSWSFGDLAGGWILFGLVPLMGLVVAVRVATVERAVIRQEQEKQETVMIP